MPSPDVLKKDKEGFIKEIVEKPKEYFSDYAVSGAYLFGKKIMPRLFELLEKQSKIKINNGEEHQLTSIIQELINEGNLSMEIIDERVKDILKIKFRLGLFNNPFIENPKDADTIVRAPYHIEIAKKASYESLVLLKNNSSNKF